MSQLNLSKPEIQFMFVLTLSKKTPRQLLCSFEPFQLLLNNKTSL